MIQWIKKRKDYTDIEAVEALQRRDRRMEDWFYHTQKRYFDEKFNQVFFDKDRKQEIFQCAFLKLWTEIDNGRISVRNEKVCRQQNDGVYRPMTCTLQTFLMAFAKNEYRELIRSNKEEYVAELFDDEESTEVTMTFDSAESIEEQKNRIIDACIQQMSPNCVEIITLFYYEGKSLDEILDLRGDKNTSKNGLKSAKSKCMNLLRERVTTEMERYHIAV